MIGSLVRLGLIFFFPRILKALSAVIRERKNLGTYVRLSLPKTRRHWALASVAIVSAVAIITRCIGYAPQPNYFRETRTNPNSPAFLIRNQYRDYISRISAYDPRINEYLQSADRTHATLPLETKEHINRLESLSVELRSTENKNVYCRFGESCYVGCTQCDKKKPLDYLIYYLPVLGLHYFVFLLAFGLLTLPKDRANMLGIGTFAVLLAGLHDGVNAYLFTINSGLMLYDAIFPNDVYTSSIERLEFIRGLIFAIALMIPLVVAIPKRENPTLKSLTSSLKTVQKSLDGLLFSRISKSVMAADEELKKALNENVIARSNRVISNLASTNDKKAATLFKRVFTRS